MTFRVARSWLCVADRILALQDDDFAARRGQPLRATREADPRPAPMTTDFYAFQVRMPL